VYKGYYRGGGPANAAMSDQTLTFSNNGAEYEIYDQSGYGNSTPASFSREAGITVRVNGKEVNLKADLTTLSGGLENLSHHPEIENTYGQ
jgi:hypothetical protein